MIEKEDSRNEPLTLTPLKAELATQSNQPWEHTWKMARMKMLGPNLTSFIFKLIHKILPTWSGIAMKGFEHATCGSVF